MTTTYNLGPQHKWKFFYPSSYGVLAGTPLVGGLVYTYEANAHTTPKVTYSTNIGGPPPAANTNPVVLDANGEAPIYLKFDDTLTNLENEYYIEVRTSAGVLIDSWDQYSVAPLPNSNAASTGSQINNYIKNPQFYWNHYAKSSGFKLNNAIASPTRYTGTYVSDEWTFTKDTSTAVETVTIAAFQAGQKVVFHNPVNYLSWNCTGASATETYKTIFQTIQGSQTFSSQTTPDSPTMWIQFWAQSTGLMQLIVNIRQYFGAGGSADVNTTAYSGNLTASWQFYKSSFTLPNTNGKTINAGDTIQIELKLPINLATDFQITNIALTMSDTAPTQNDYPYESNSQTITKENQLIFNIPCGESIASYATSIPGYVSSTVNLGTIGNVASLATVFANENAWPLYNLLYTNTTLTVSTGRGASAILDFDANKTILLPAALSNFIVGAGATYALGLSGGSATSSQVPAHTHSMTQHYGIDGTTPGTSRITVGADTYVSAVVAAPSNVSVAATGAVVGAHAIDIIPPYVAANQFIKT